MSNKPKGAKGIVEYKKTAGERRHDGLVKQAKTMRLIYGGSKHVGSKPESVLRQSCKRYTN